MLGAACGGIALLGSLQGETARPLDLPFGTGPGFPATIGVAVALGVGCSLLGRRSRPPGARRIATAAWIVSSALFLLIVAGAVAGVLDTEPSLRAAYAAWLVGLALASASAWIRLAVVPRLQRTWPDPLPPPESALLEAWPTPGAAGAGRAGDGLPT